MSTLPRNPPRETTGLSCLMPFYAKDSVVHARIALESVLSQTRPPDELVLVKDGPLPDELDSLLAEYSLRISARLVPLASNQGLGIALRTGLEACSRDLVVRMDADDVARPHRFELQENLMRANPGLAVLGGAIEEFNEHAGDLGRQRHLPLVDSEIRHSARTRNPFNHMTVSLRRQAALAAGSYRHRPGFEDYDLWLRILALPSWEVANVDEVLVDARIGNGMVSRRRGWRYMQSEVEFLRACCRESLIRRRDLWRSVLMRAPLRLLPGHVLGWIYDRGLRRRRKD